MRTAYRLRLRFSRAPSEERRASARHPPYCVPVPEAASACDNLSKRPSDPASERASGTEEGGGGRRLPLCHPVCGETPEMLYSSCSSCSCMTIGFQNHTSNTGDGDVMDVCCLNSTAYFSYLLVTYTHFFPVEPSSFHLHRSPSRIYRYQLRTFSLVYCPAPPSPDAIHHSLTHLLTTRQLAT